MAAIINHMRLYSRQTAGNELQSIGMNDAVEGVLTLTAHQLLVHNVKVDKELATDLPNVQLDQIRLEQVIMNLITNARHAMEKFRTEGLQLEIRSCLQDVNEVALTIRDNGGGVPEAAREKIFEPFFTTKEAGKGTGLGLSVAKKIVTEAGGRIELESIEGEGSTFKIVLPVA
ncbi:MAG: ATP-binding protein, partial [Desulfobacterales bacterium]